MLCGDLKTRSIGRTVPPVSGTSAPDLQRDDDASVVAGGMGHSLFPGRAQALPIRLAMFCFNFPSRIFVADAKCDD